MEDARPGWPRVVGGPLIEIEKVDVVARLSVTMGKLNHRAGEGVVAYHTVQSVTILQGIRWHQPVSVLINDGFSANLH